MATQELVTVPDDIDKSTHALTIQAGEYFDELIMIKTDEDFDKANVMLKKITSAMSAAKKDRVAITSGIEKSKKLIIAKYKPGLDKLDAAKIIQTDRIKAHLKIKEDEARRIEAVNVKRREAAEAEVEKKRLEKIKAAEALEKEGGIDNELDAEALRVDAETMGVEVSPDIEKTASILKVDGRLIKKKWRVDIVNVNIVPKAFLIPDMKLLMDMAKDEKPAPIGCEFTEI